MTTTLIESLPAIAEYWTEFPWWKFCGPEAVEVATFERCQRRLLELVLAQFSAIDHERISPKAWQRVEPVRDEDLQLGLEGEYGCPNCADYGTIRISMDPADEITCHECGGDGCRIPDARSRVALGPLHFHGYYIRLISSLPGCEWRETDPDRRHEVPIHFRWFAAGDTIRRVPVGDGLLMPMAWEG